MPAKASSITVKKRNRFIRLGLKVSEWLCRRGVIGRLGVDFISVKEQNQWKHYAIEVNLRKGGTTHPYLMLQFLTDGTYDQEKDSYYTANGQARYYYATDNLESRSCKRCSPQDLIDLAMCQNLLYDGSSQGGVVFHMIGALSQFGKIGVVCIGSTRARARQFYLENFNALNSPPQ